MERENDESIATWTDYVARVVEFLDVSDVPFENAEYVICAKIAQLVDSPVTCLFFCPQSGDGNGQYLAVRSDTSSVEILSTDLPDVNVMHGRRRVLSVHVPDFEEGDHINPHLHVYFETEIPPPALHTIERVIADLVTRIVRRQFALLRRCLINSRIDSNDLGTFLHRTLVVNRMHRHIGVEAASIFVQDPIGKLLRLRGTTGMKSGKPKSDVFFHEDDPVKVWDVLRVEKPLTEFDSIDGLSEGESAERVIERPYYRLYWPIRLRDRLRGREELYRTPTIGVLRLVNSSDPVSARRPYTWLRHAVVNYMAEMLFVVIDGYISVDAAGFKRDEAFHGSASVIDTVCKNIDLVRRVLYDDIHPAMEEKPIRRQFELVPRDRTAGLDTSRIKTLLNTAYASATDLSFQIERANQHTPGNGKRVTKRLMTDVVLRAWEQTEDMKIAHSAREGFDRPTNKQLFDRADYPPTVYGAPEALVSVFANVLENAIKYRTPGKPIHLDLNFETTPENVIIRLRDKGIGIREGDEERIFTSGYRTPEARDFVKRGSGLGLAWCRDVLHPIEGRIYAKRRKPGLEIFICLRRVAE